MKEIKKKWYVDAPLPLRLLLCAVVGLSPLIVGIIGAQISETLTGCSCNEANCFWGALPWLSMLSIPLAIILAVMSICKSIADFARRKRK